MSEAKVIRKPQKVPVREQAISAQPLAAHRMRSDPGPDAISIRANK